MGLASTQRESRRLHHNAKVRHTEKDLREHLKWVLRTNVAFKWYVNRPKKQCEKQCVGWKRRGSPLQQERPTKDQSDRPPIASEKDIVVWNTITWTKKTRETFWHLKYRSKMGFIERTYEEEHLSSGSCLGCEAVLLRWKSCGNPVFHIFFQ